MAIRPIDVRRKEFKSGFRGYDANQVDDFLDQVADEFERAYTDNQRMREEISGLRERLQQFEDLEGSIRSALVHAEQAANDLRNSAQREADELRLSSERDAESLRISSQREAELTIQEAQARSHQMLADSSSRVERIQDSYEALVEAKREFKNEFRQLLKTYMDVMEDMEISTAKGIESSLRERLDTESIAVAREAASREESGESREGPLYTAPEGEEDLDAPENGYGEEPVESSEATQRIDLSEETVTSEPETDPSSAERDYLQREEGTSDLYEEDRENSGTNEPAGEERRADEESGLPPDERAEAADRFFDGGDREERRRDEEQEDSRIFRASRFLRRRS